MNEPFEITNERKLTAQQVLVIRAIHIPRSPLFGSVVLAGVYGVSQVTIDRLIKRATYRELHPLTLPNGMLEDSSYVSDKDGNARIRHNWRKYELESGCDQEKDEETDFERASTKGEYRLRQAQIRRGFLEWQKSNSDYPSLNRKGAKRLWVPW
ncbi:hypothetical protein [Paraburkholderia sp. BR14374]|uniref:hypothetical protein n=1 Tax=Paraburkholderia sp. BR14374 TaxID=3237007 RepID=UPI0034CEF9D9